VSKFDVSCGLTAKEIGIIKDAIRRSLLKSLPIFSDSVEMKLFFEGRDAWIYAWELLGEAQSDRLSALNIGIQVKLKKEFHYQEIQTQHFFLCSVQRKDDIYHPAVLVREESVKRT